MGFGGTNGNGSIATSSDVALSNLTADNTLSYNATTQKWRNSAVSIADGSITNAKVASNAGITQDKIANLTTSLAAKINTSQIGAANGVAGLDSSSHIPKTQLGTGTANSSTYLRGDGVWSSISGLIKVTPSNSGGSVDDAAIIQTAIDALADTNGDGTDDGLGGLVLLEAGFYNIKSKIILRAGIRLSGSSTNSVILNMTTSVVGDVLVMHAGTVLEQVSFSVSTGIGRTSGSVVSMESNQCVVDQCTFASHFIGISVGTSSINAVNTRIINCSFSNPTKANGAGGIQLNQFGNAVIDNCVMSTSTAQNSQTNFGINYKSGDTSLLSNTNITGHGTALLINTPTNGAGGGCHALQVVNCLFDSAGTMPNQAAASNVMISPSPTGTVYNTLFSNCWIGGSAGANGCWVGTTGSGLVDGLSFANCHFIGNAQHGLCLVGTGVKHVTVTGGTSVQNGIAGIKATSNTTRFTITGHAAGGTTDADSNFRGRGRNDKGIVIDAGCNEYVITGCNLLGNVSASLEEPTPGASRVVANNLSA